MAWALSESIFCWPRTRVDLLREERFPPDAVCVLDFLAPADVEEACAAPVCVCAVDFVVEGFLAVVSLVALWRAVAAEHAQIKMSAHMLTNRAPRTSVQNLTTNLTSKTLLASTKRKAQPEADPVIILDQRLQCQFQVELSKLRKCTRQEDRPILPRRTPRTHQEYNILPALQARLDPGEFFLAVDRLLVDFQDDVAAS